MGNVIIYHEVKEGVPCPDGQAAAWIAMKALGSAQLIGWTYQSELMPIIEPGSNVVIVDFSFPKSILEEWGQHSTVTVIDHHITAMQNLEGLSDRVLAKFDMAECGATLTWKHFFPDQPMPAFLEYVKDRDLWDFLLPHSQEVHEAVAHLKYKAKSCCATSAFAIFDALAKLNQADLLALLMPIGEPLLEPKRKKIDAVFDRHEWGEVAGHSSIPFVRLAEDGSEDRLVSDICMKLYRSFPNAYFVACITSDGSWSLRSDKHGNNTDVGSIAKSMNGGGHKNAAGYHPDRSQEAK